MIWPTCFTPWGFEKQFNNMTHRSTTKNKNCFKMYLVFFWNLHPITWFYHGCFCYGTIEIVINKDTPHWNNLHRISLQLWYLRKIILEYISKLKCKYWLLWWIFILEELVRFMWVTHARKYKFLPTKNGFVVSSFTFYLRVLVIASIVWLVLIDYLMVQYFNIL